MKNAFTAKTKVLLLLLLAVAGMAKAQQWRELHTGVTEDLYDICCIDENTIFVSGQNGVILKTEDGGVTWQEKHRYPDWEIISIKFVNDSIGYGLVTRNYSYPVFLLKTIDSGETWFRVNASSFPEMSLSDYRYDDPLELFMVGKPFELFVLNADTLFIRYCETISRSTDGGVSFVAYELGFYEYWGNPHVGIKGEYFEDDFGWVIGYDNENHNTLRIMKTEDCGDNWDNIANYEFSELYINAVCPGKDRCAKIYGEFYIYDLNGSREDYNMIETTDGFEHVTMYQTEGDDIGYWCQFSDIAFDSQEHGCSISSINWDKEFYSDSHAYISNDSGLSWTEVPYGIYDKMFVYSVAATDSTFFIASQKGVLYKFDSSPYLGADEHSDTNLSPSLTVFPNPTNDKIVIEGIKPTEAQVYNTLGQLVKTVTGSNEINMDGLVEGVYLLKVTDKGGVIHTGKVMKKSE